MTSPCLRIPLRTLDLHEKIGCQPGRTREGREPDERGFWRRRQNPADLLCLNRAAAGQLENQPVVLLLTIVGQRPPISLPGRLAKPAFDTHGAGWRQLGSVRELQVRLTQCAGVEPLQADASDTIRPHRNGVIARLVGQESSFSVKRSSARNSSNAAGARAVGAPWDPRLQRGRTGICPHYLCAEFWRCRARARAGIPPGLSWRNQQGRPAPLLQRMRPTPAGQRPA